MIPTKKAFPTTGRLLRLLRTSRTGAGAPKRLPLGEAVTKIGFSKPILVTDEGKTGSEITDILR